MEEAFTEIMAVCGIIASLGTAGAVIWKVIRPAFQIVKRVEVLEKNQAKDFKRLATIEDFQKKQAKALAALLNHQIDGNGVEKMKIIRDELLQAVIEN